LDDWSLAREFAQKRKGNKNVSNYDIANEYKKIVKTFREYSEEGYFFPSINGTRLEIKDINKDNKEKIIWNMELNCVTVIKHKCSDGIKKGVWIRIEK
ncbi:MAG: hypothetical protein AABY22_34730, partial [Nanoarchaeota archaeon]